MFIELEGQAAGHDSTKSEKEQGMCQDNFTIIKAILNIWQFESYEINLSSAKLSYLCGCTNKVPFRQLGRKPRLTQGFRQIPYFRNNPSSLLVSNDSFLVDDHLLTLPAYPGTFLCEANLQQIEYLHDAQERRRHND